MVLLLEEDMVGIDTEGEVIGAEVLFIDVCVGEVVVEFVNADVDLGADVMLAALLFVDRVENVSVLVMEAGGAVRDMKSVNWE